MYGGVKKKQRNIKTLTFIESFKNIKVITKDKTVTKI